MNINIYININMKIQIKVFLFYTPKIKVLICADNQRSRKCQILNA